MIKRLSSDHSIKTLCRVLNVNRSTYYKHFNSKISNRTLENQDIRKKILKIYTDCDKRIGAYKINHILKRDYGINISVGRVYRLIQKMNLPKMMTKKPKFKHKEADFECKNILNQNFYPEAPNQVWASDITYLKVNNKWVYLCIIMDLFSRKIIAWNTSTKIDAKLVISTFKMACSKRNLSENLMFHSDRGSQYIAKDFRKLLDSYNVLQSFSKKGYPYDNAVVESFFKHLKREETNRRTYNSLNDLNLSLFEYIEGFYNNKRPHATLDYMTPSEKEVEYFQKN